jgi:hypothetical protein
MLKFEKGWLSNLILGVYVCSVLHYIMKHKENTNQNNSSTVVVSSSRSSTVCSLHNGSYVPLLVLRKYWDISYI